MKSFVVSQSSMVQQKWQLPIPVNDQAETFLLRLIRGSGGAGLGGIAPGSNIGTPKRNDQDTVSLFRPLLCITRDEVISYCEVIIWISNGLIESLA